MSARAFALFVPSGIEGRTIFSTVLHLRIFLYFFLGDSKSSLPRRLTSAVYPLVVPLQGIGPLYDDVRFQNKRSARCTVGIIRGPALPPEL